MTLESLSRAWSPHITAEAVHLLYDLLGHLHAVAANADGVLFALSASPALADRLAAFGAEWECDEDDGTDELDARSDARVTVAVLALSPREVPHWSPSPSATIPIES